HGVVQLFAAVTDIQSTQLTDVHRVADIIGSENRVVGIASGRDHQLVAIYHGGIHVLGITIAVQQSRIAGIADVVYSDPFSEVMSSSVQQISYGEDRAYLPWGGNMLYQLRVIDVRSI